MGDAKFVTERMFSFCNKHKRALGLVLLFTSLVVTGLFWAQNKVYIVADGKQLVVRTFYSDPNRVLRQVGVVLGPEDEYSISTKKIINGTNIVVHRCIPLTITYLGDTTIVRTAKVNVGEVVASLGIHREQIKTIPEESTETIPGMDIRVINVSEKVIEQDMPAPFPVVYHQDANMEKGTSRVVEQGEEGLQIAVVQLLFEDGEQVAAQQIASNLIVAPKPRVVAVGMRDTVETSRGTQRFRDVKWMEATMYNPTDGAPHGLTATGIPARYGIVAVDPDVIPLGTRLYIPGYGVALAADTGGAIIGDKIDLCVEDYGEAMSFGRRTVKVYVLAE